MRDSDALNDVIVPRRWLYEEISNMMNHNITITRTNPN